MATPFTPRKRAAIRDTILANWQARYRAIGLDLLIVRGSDAYMQADAFALELEGIEAQAAQTRNEILPDKASSAGLDRHGFVDGVPRRTATRARFTVQGVCAGRRTLKRREQGRAVGRRARVRARGRDRHGHRRERHLRGTGQGGHARHERQPPGRRDPPVVDHAGQRAIERGQRAERHDHGGRRRARRRLRPAHHPQAPRAPGSGNRADWADWALQCDGVAECYVFPLLAPDLSLTTPTLGAVSIMPMGPAQAAARSTRGS
jgi:hypothetical protein